MSKRLQFDEDAARALERVYRTPDVVEQRGRTLQRLDPQPGERILDVGVGPGLLARDIAATVGDHGSCVGIDVSATMVDAARTRCEDLACARFEEGDATALSFSDDVFDAAVSTQVYEYVVDVPLALRELHRVLRPGGRAVIVDTDADSWVLHTSDPGRHARVRAAWDEHTAHPRLPRDLTALLRQAGFRVGRPEVIPMFNTSYHPNTYGYGMLGFVQDFAARHPAVGPDIARAWRKDLEELGAAGQFFFSINRYQFFAEKPM